MQPTMHLRAIIKNPQSITYFRQATVTAMYDINSVTKIWLGTSGYFDSYVLQ